MIGNFFDIHSHSRMLSYANISKMKTMVIDGVSYYYANVNGLYHFYPKNNRLYKADKVEKFQKQMNLPLISDISDIECAKDNFGHNYLGFAMTIDTFIYHLPYYIYFVKYVETPKTFYDWLSTGF